MMNDEEAILTSDQLSVVEKWLDYMKKCDRRETLSLSEIAEIQSVYDLIKHAIY